MVFESTDVEQLAHTLHALADPTRLRILQVLSHGEHCVCEIRAHLDSVPGNLLSHHLRVLREAGLVESKRSGRWVHYRICEGALEEVCAALPKHGSQQVKVCACRKEGPKPRLHLGGSR